MSDLKKDFFYITTPLYYVNDRPHLGTAYSTVIADILNRYHCLFGRKTFFLTGTDEHGQKCEQAAKKRGLSPKEHCQKMRSHFKEVWEKLNIKWTPIGEKDGSFFYTSHRYKGDRPDHTKTVQDILQKLKDRGDIYQKNYKGWYCVSEEIFYTEKDLVKGQSPSGKEVIPLEEKAWFFKMSKYQDHLIKHLENHPLFIRPMERQNEIKGFLKKPLRDLCVSRPKKRVSWGIDLPFDSSCVVYVWVDALLNYITGAGYGFAKEDFESKKKDQEDFENYWKKAGAIHLIGKDILMTHAVYWPCLLLALEIPLPKTIFAHGWLLNKSAKKMSKSQGDKLDPLELAQVLGVDGLRYFLAKDIILGKDSALSKDLMSKKINEDLADNLGNIFSRVSCLIEKCFKGSVPKEGQSDQQLKQMTEDISSRFEGWIKNFELSQALGKVSLLLTELNKYLEREAPWKTVKEDKKRAGQTLYNVLEVLRISAIWLFPVMPEKMARLLSDLGEDLIVKKGQALPILKRAGKELNFKQALWGEFPFDKPIKQTQPLFPKIKLLS